MERCDNCPRRGGQCVGEFQDIAVSIEELQTDLLCAIKMLYKNDYYLLKTQVNEVCITSHIFHYFSTLFAEKYCNYHIDPEYNRNGLYSKFYGETYNGRQHYAKPDLLIHKRNCNKHNLLYVEFKPYWNCNTYEDYEKIKHFISNESFDGNTHIKISYRYKYGVSILLDKEEIKFAWFQNGSDNVVEENSVLVHQRKWIDARS